MYQSTINLTTQVWCYLLELYDIARKNSKFNKKRIIIIQI